MLQTISWSKFFEFLLPANGAWYSWVLIRYYRSEIRAWIKKHKLWVLLIPALAGYAVLRAQTADGNAGINQANTTIRGYFDAATNLMYAVGAILGLIGAVKVYDRWLHGHNETNKYAAAWVGGCIFLVIASSVLKSFFGL